MLNRFALSVTGSFKGHVKWTYSTCALLYRSHIGITFTNL